VYNVVVRRKLTFGLYALEPERKLGALLNTFCEWLGEKLNADVGCDETPDYQTLAQRLRAGQIDIAWLPPIVFLRVDESAEPVVAIRRGTRGGFETALVVREDSPITDAQHLRDRKAAWVDAWSAAGYVIPRFRLRLSGIDPSTLFNEEHFYGTHSGAVRAVIDGRADVAGTYAQTDEAGAVVDGPWTQIEGARIRVLTTFGEIPSDVFAVAAPIAEVIRAPLAAALVATAENEEHRAMVKQLFGADAFGPVALESYEGLRAALSVGDWEELSTA
jgi:phosphate/phosphite/phosphonate ABC transporter binding protein